LDRLVRVSPLRDFPVRAFIVDDAVVNAETDGRDIYFHYGLLQAAAGDEAQIAGIMGHELGHILGNHVKSQVTRTAVNALLSAAAAGARKENANRLLQEAAGVSSAAYSRNEEKEADIIGAALAHRAGYDSEGLIRFFIFLQRLKAADGAKYAALLAPLVSNYNQAVRNYQASVYAYNTTGSPQAYASAGQWASAVNQYAAAINRVLYEYQSYLGTANPLYLSHPPDPERLRTVSLIRNKELYGGSEAWLAAQDPGIGYVYRILSARSPKD